MTTAKKDVKSLPSDVTRNWGWLVALGIIFVLLGAAGLGMTVYLTLVSMFFFGVLLVIGGVSQLVDSFKSTRWKGILWHALIGVLYIICGGIVIYDPFLASIYLTMFIGGLLIIIGISRILMVITLKDLKVWGLILVSGLAAIILGIMILAHWPLSGMWVIGLFIAIELMIVGWTYIFIGVSLRGAKQ
jgi:uncharacterized membrane protein HdeD (DUF308 family)